MKKIKNKFLISVFFLILLVIFSAFFIGFFKQNIDRSSYAELISGSGFLNEKPLELGKKEKVKKFDEIKTLGGESMIIIEWGDGSITRLGENTSIKVNENYFSENGDVIQVAFKIFSGKTWSNVLSYIPGDSYFKQAFEDTEVAVRGTVFTLDLEKKYIYVEKHRVVLEEKNGKTLEIEEKNPLSIEDFSFISLSNFILEFRDKLFFEKNKKLDEELYLYLKRELEKQLKNLEKLKNIDIQKISQDELEKTYKDVLSVYQKLNFVSTKDGEVLFGLKIDIKQKLLELSSVGEKANLAQSFFYDFKDTVQSQKFYSLDEITKTLIENKEYFDFGRFLEFLEGLNIKENFTKAVKKNLEDLKTTFEISIDVGGKVFDAINDIDKKARDGLFELKDTAEEKVEEGLYKIVDGKKVLEEKAQKTLEDGARNLENFLEEKLKESLNK